MLQTINKGPEDVLIDSTSLFRVLKEPPLKSQFVAKITNPMANIRLLFSPLVFEETLDHGNKSFVIKQLLEIGNLAKEFGKIRFAWAPMPQDAFLTEALAPIESTPVADEETSQKYLSYFSDQEALATFIARYNSKPQSWKSDRLIADKAVNNLAQKKVKAGNSLLSRNNILKYIQDYQGTSSESPFFQSAIKDLNETGKCFVKPEEAIKQPSRYPFLYTWACLADLTGFGNAFPDDDPHEIAHRLKPDKGNWYDNSLASTAALCKTLITQDKNLIWKCNHLFERKLIRFFSEKIEDFITSSSGGT